MLTYWTEIIYTRLKEHLLTNYRADTIPTQSEPLNLSLGIAQAFNNIDQKRRHCFIKSMAKDIDGMTFILRWNESEWNNVTSVTMRTDPQLEGGIWTPDIYLYNTAENPLKI